MTELRLQRILQAHEQLEKQVVRAEHKEQDKVGMFDVLKKTEVRLGYGE